MSEYKTFKELDVWLKSRALVGDVYLMTQSFPKEELYSLVSQMRRCAISIPSNIAEGYGRQYKKEIIHFFILPEVRYMNWKHYYKFHPI